MRIVGLLCRWFTCAGVASALAATPAAAQSEGGDLCLTANPPPLSAEPQAVRFGVTPQAAGSAGLGQQAVVPPDEAALDRALVDLRPPGRALVVRLNRLFSADGQAGIDRFAALAGRYAALGLGVEVQVRYHPAPEDEGDMEAWARFVDQAATTLARQPAVVALSIVNEPNLPISPNTSDGAYDGVREAVVRGVVAARAALDRAGRRDVELGFTFAWRWAPNSDRAFWQEIGRRATDEFRAAVDYVGLQVYPGLVWPPVPLPGRSAGAEVVEAATLVRDCFMPQAGLGRGVELWISENGYPTNLGRNEAMQAADARSTFDAVHRYSGTLGITEYRWFNLRDNDSDGTDLFSAVGLLRDDHSAKPSFAIMRDAVARYGAPLAPAAGVGSRSRACHGSRRLPRGAWRSARTTARGGRATLRAGRVAVRIRLRRPAARRRVGVLLRARGGSRVRRVAVLVRCGRSTARAAAPGRSSPPA